MLNNKTISFIAIVFFLQSQVCTIASASSENILKDPDYSLVKLSPDGKHLALVKNNQENQELIVIDSQTMKAVNNVLFPSDNDIENLDWANDKRLVLALNTDYVRHYRKRNVDKTDDVFKQSKQLYIPKAKNLATSYQSTDLYAIDFNQSDGQFIFGKRSVQTRGKEWHQVNQEKSQIHQRRPEVISVMPNDPEHILIKTHHYNETFIYKLNINQGELQLLTQLDYRPNDYYYENQHQQLWVNFYDKDKKLNQINQFDFTSQKWLPLSVTGISREFSFAGYNADNKQLIIRDYCGNNSISFCLLEPKNGSITTLYTNSSSDLNQLLTDSSLKPVGFNFSDEYPSYHLDNKAEASAELISHIIDAFKGFKINYQFASHNNKTALIEIEGDTKPKEWYLLNTESKTPLTFIISSYKNLDPQSLNPTYSFKFDTDDQVTIQAFATLPKSENNQLPPALLLVNSDLYKQPAEWRFQPQVQYFASLGFAVIQVNTRGSLGFGEAFKNLGRPIHKAAIQQDMLDALDFLVKNGQIDKNKICVMGKDFGAKSALKTALMQPEQFNCLILDSGDYDHSDDETRNQHSLVNRVQDLKTPTLVLYGKKGKNQFEARQANFLIDQLKAQDKTFDVFERDKDDYYLDNEENRLEHFQAISQFLTLYNPVK